MDLRQLKAFTHCTPIVIIIVVVVVVIIIIIIIIITARYLQWDWIFLWSRYLAFCGQHFVVKVNPPKITFAKFGCHEHRHIPTQFPLQLQSITIRPFQLAFLFLDPHPHQFSLVLKFEKLCYHCMAWHLCQN